MNTQDGNPFDTIESAQEFVKLLTKSICEAKREVGEYVEGESTDNARRLDALRIVLYTLGKLEIHMRQSSRILNDLRTLRRLLVAEGEVKKTTTLSSAQSTDSENYSAKEMGTQPATDRFPV
jgi:hypothetical protein